MKKHTIDTMRNALKKNIAYSVIGSYAKGSASTVATLRSDLNSKVLGKNICSFDRAAGESFNPLDITIDLNDRQSSPDRMNLLKGLIEYSTGLIDDAAHKLRTVRSVSEEKKVNLLHKYGKSVFEKVTGKAYAEGMVDDELKEDIRTIIETGKQRFEQRNKEVLDQEAVEVSEHEGIAAPDANPMDEMNANPNFQDDFNFNDPGMGDPASGNDFMSQDLGLDKDFGNFEQDNKPSLDEVGDQMNAIATSKSESFFDFNLDEFTKPYAEQNSFVFNGMRTTLTREQIDRTVDKLLEIEENVFNEVAKGEGVKVINTDEYAKRSKHMINELAVTLTVREALHI